MRLPPGGCHVAHSLCSGMPFSPVRSNAVVQPLSLVTGSGGGDRSSPRWSNAVSWFHKGHGRRYDSVSRWTCSIDGSRGSIQSIDGDRDTARPQAAIRELLPLADSLAQRRGRLRFRPALRPRHSPVPRSSRAFNPNPPQGYTPAGQGRGAGGFASGSAGATLERGGRRDTVPRRRAPPARRQARPSRRAVHRRYGRQASLGRILFPASQEAATPAPPRGSDGNRRNDHHAGRHLPGPRSPTTSGTRRSATPAPSAVRRLILSCAKLLGGVSRQPCLVAPPLSPRGETTCGWMI